MTQKIYIFTVIAALLLAVSVTGTALARQLDSALTVGLGQETPVDTETPTPTETVEVSETTTSTPTAVITDTPTATETSVITETPTATATAIVTETTTATPTPISTVPPLTPSPVPTTPAQGAKITIVKDTQPDGTDGSRFYGAFGAFTLTDDGSSSQDRITYTVPVGNYNFSEVISTTYFLKAIDCSNNGSTGDEDITVNLRTRVLSVNAQNGDNIVCTYVNQRRVAITVNTYNDDNGNGEQDSAESADDNVGVWLYHKDFDKPVYNVTDASGILSFVRLKPGDYKVCASDLENRNNTQPGSIDSEVGLPCYDITLDPAEDATVSFGHSNLQTPATPSQPAPSAANGITIRLLTAGMTPVYQNAIDLSNLDNGPSVYLPMIRR